MEVCERSRRGARRLVDRLYREYGRFNVRAETYHVSHERFVDRRTRFARAGVGQVRVWLTNDDDDLLLVRSPSGTTWRLPETAAGTNESVESAAIRCVEEAAGIQALLTGLYQVRRLRIVDETAPESVLHLVCAGFDAVAVEQVRGAAGGETLADWFASPPPAVSPVVDARPEAWNRENSFSAGRAR